MSKSATVEEHLDFSLVLGGPLFSFYRRAHLSGELLEFLHRRVLIVSLFAWLPLLLLSAIDGHALNGAIKIPFLYDIETHVRFLVALPLLIIAEVNVHLRLGNLVKSFVERRIIVREEMPAYRAAIDSASRLCNSVTAECAFVVLVYTVGVWLWRNQIATGAASWYATPDGSSLHLTLAGYWFAFVSIPIFQFMLLRWYFRFFIWARFLWRVSKLKLHLIATHPDRAGGLGFLSQSTYAFSPVLFVQGALLSGLIASRILYQGQNLLSFKMEVGGLVALFVLLVLVPLIMFSPRLTSARRQGMREYGLLASRYVEGFEKKWVHGDVSSEEDLVGSGDIQSLADLEHSFSIVKEMSVVPFGLWDVVGVVVAIAAPLLPLVLTIFSLDEVLSRLIKILL